MKRSIVILLVCVVQVVCGQAKYFTKTGTVQFFAGTAVEDIDAINKSLTSVFEISSGRIEFAALIKGFEFKRGLMQEHFNENYLESDKYPKAVFKGTCADLSKIDFKKDGTYPVAVVGTLEIHGVSKEVGVPGEIKIEKGIVSSHATFKVLLKDYKVEIPGAVKDKISSVVEIKINCVYKGL
jgi:hypothetical protein